MAIYTFFLVFDSNIKLHVSKYTALIFMAAICLILAINIDMFLFSHSSALMYLKAADLMKSQEGTGLHLLVLVKEKAAPDDEEELITGST